MVKLIIKGVGAGIVLGLSLIALLEWVLPTIPTIQKALTPQPERFTELYFADHLALPKTLPYAIAIDTPIVIHNLEYRPMTYPVVVTAQSQATPSARFKLLATTVSLGHDQTQTVPIQVKLPRKLFPGRTKVEVELVNLDQTIHFWVELGEKI